MFGYRINLDELRDNCTGIRRKYFKVGGTEVEVVNDFNKRFLINDLWFRMNVNGEVEVLPAGMNTLHSLEELKETIMKYKKMYKRFQELSKEIKMSGDFE